jgi:chromosome segregation ATPase
MGIRSTLGSFLASPASQAMEPDIRRVVEEALASRPAASADTSELEARIAKLEKKLNMAMGAVQAATAQIMALKQDLQAVDGKASQASQYATTARATAEAAADGVTGAENQIATLLEQLGSASPAKAAPKTKRATPKKAAPKKAAPKKAAPKKAAPKKAAPKKAASNTVKKGAPKKKAAKKAAKVCSVKGCKNAYRAKGYCGSHYQQWKRGTLG